MTTPDNDHEYLDVTLTTRDGDFYLDYGLACPACGQTEGVTDVGQTVFGYCKSHKTKWFAGFRRHYQDSEGRRRNEERLYNEIGLGSFEFTEAQKELCERLRRVGS
jgi:hypothetical protein